MIAALYVETDGAYFGPGAKSMVIFPNATQRPRGPRRLPKKIPGSSPTGSGRKDALMERSKPWAQCGKRETLAGRKSRKGRHIREKMEVREQGSDKRTAARMAEADKLRIKPKAHRPESEGLAQDIRSYPRRIREDARKAGGGVRNLPVTPPEDEKCKTVVRRPLPRDRNCSWALVPPVQCDARAFRGFARNAQEGGNILGDGK